MLIYLKGNILNSSAQALVNTVNTVGVMGKGVALQFKKAFPLNFKNYAAVCKKGELKPGKLLVFKENILSSPLNFKTYPVVSKKGEIKPGKLLLVKEQTRNCEKIIINFPTKTEWYLDSKYEYIDEGLKELVKVIEQNKIKSIAIPPLGCGNGNLKWNTVKLMIEEYLGDLTDVDVQIYEPNEAVKEIPKSYAAIKDKRKI